MKNLMYLILSQVLLGRKSQVASKQTRQSRQEDPQIEVVAQNLEIPWDLEINKGGKIYFTERPGRIRVIEEGVLRPEPLYTFSDPFITFGEGGLMGIKLDPNHEENRYIYAMHSYTQENEVYNRVVRLVEEDGGPILIEF